MRKIKIRFDELKNPEFLSPEIMMTIFGGANCNSNTHCDIYAGDTEYPGHCIGDTGVSFCLCKEDGGETTSPQPECMAV